MSKIFYKFIAQKVKKMMQKEAKIMKQIYLCRKKLSNIEFFFIRKTFNRKHVFRLLKTKTQKNGLMIVFRLFQIVFWIFFIF